MNRNINSKEEKVARSNEYKEAHFEFVDESKRAFHENTKTASYLYVKDASRIQLPGLQPNQPPFYMTIDGVECPYKRLLFSAFNAGLYFCNKNPEEMGRSLIGKLKHIFMFWAFIKELPLSEEQLYEAIKLFEAWRVDANSVKVQSSGAATIILLLTIALSFKEFRKTLSAKEFNFIENLTQTRLAKHDERAPVTLNHWFSQHTWLRRSDVGVGDNYYKRLSSPSALMSSFRVTTVTLLQHIQKSKDVLIDWFRDAGITDFDIEKIRPVEEFSSANEQSRNTQRLTSCFFDLLKKKLKDVREIPPELLDAIELVVYSNCSKDDKETCLNSILSIRTSRKKIVFLTGVNPSHPIFSISFLRELALFSSHSGSTDKTMPVCEGETMIFAWLMAYQTVQTGDISKLQLNDFSFMRRRDGIITHIECKYFKGRAKAYHRLETLSTNTHIGSAILRYLKDISGLENSQIRLVSNMRTAYLSGKMSLASRLFLALGETRANTLFLARLEREKVTSVFYTAYETLMLNGKTNRSYVNAGEYPVQATIFGHSAIKTSAIYASTDTFDPTSLINSNSHTNDTEKSDYRDERNIEWDNICGRVTRAVMRDLYVNVFRQSKQQEANFQSEFTRALDFIKGKSQQVYATLKIVTQREGSVNELGMSKEKTVNEGDLPDTVYIVDSAQTVMKMKHYLEEVRQKHRILKETDPEYFFSTVLPTIEWVEQLFDQSKFSSKSLLEGTALYDQYKEYLPPHFNHKLV